MYTARVAFAGLSPLCEEILLAGLRERSDIQLVTPWTRLPSLEGGAPQEPPEFLFVELGDPDLPPALRVLLVAAEPLRIVGLSADARAATLFTIREQRTVLFDYSAAELWGSVAQGMDPRIRPGFEEPGPSA